VTLSAVVIAGDKVTALLTDNATGQTVRKRPGDVMDSWEVAQVLAEKVVLTQGEEKLELQLRNFDQQTSPPPTANARRANPRRAGRTARRRPRFTPTPPPRSSAAAQRAAEIYQRLAK